MAKPYYEFFCPVKVIAGNAALEHIPFELATLGAKRPMIITRPKSGPDHCRETSRTTGSTRFRQD